MYHLKNKILTNFINKQFQKDNVRGNLLDPPPIFQCFFNDFFHLVSMIFENV